MRITITLMLLALLAQTSPKPAGDGGPPQQPPVTFKVEVNYVEIDANVTDAQGNFVRTLTRDDFQVIEDGKPQALTAFSMVDIPIDRIDPPLFSKTAIPPDVVSNRTPFEGRVFVLVLDDLNTRANRTSRTRAAARLFVERYIGANDVVAVVNTSGYAKAMQDFTGNRQLALKAIDAAIGNKADSETVAKLQDYEMNRGMPGGASNANASFNDLQRYNNARNAMQTLTGLADFMAGMRGRRKAVVYFSEGLNYNLYDPINNRYATDVQREIQLLVAAATRANVNVYSVDPRGLATGMEDAIEIGSLPADGSITTTALMNEMRQEHDSLRIVADETGGFAVLNQNDFRTGFSRILEDNSSYYVLGYYPTNEKTDGKFRNVQVKVLPPGLRVRARRGYTAPTPPKKEKPEKGSPTEKTSAPLRDALDSPIAISGLTISVFAAPFKGAGGKDAIALSIEVDGSGLKFTQNPQGLFANDLEITLFASDQKGKIQDGARDVVSLALRPQTHDVVRQGVFRVVRRIQVPPGKYQLRIGARESGGGKVGTVIYDLDAPDFSKGNLTMSGIALASASGSRFPTATPDPSVNEFKDVLPSPPSASREFPRQDQLAVFAEVYDNDVKTPHRVEITAAVLADDGKVVHTTSDTRKSDELQGATGGYGYTTQIPLAAFAPGRYVLRLTATSLLGKPAPVVREIEFRVR
ncbi:MAG TPA: VWA domain-containing protein [Vicinamibacterales bacterium]|nr:VWA domain-containing protein [Vicinamibacterales bacterium]